jgi:hypothetical protein
MHWLFFASLRSVLADRLVSAGVRAFRPRIPLLRWLSDHNDIPLLDVFSNGVRACAWCLPAMSGCDVRLPDPRMKNYLPRNNTRESLASSPIERPSDYLASGNTTCAHPTLALPQNSPPTCTRCRAAMTSIPSCIVMHVTRRQIPTGLFRPATR